LSGLTDLVRSWGCLSVPSLRADKPSPTTLRAKTLEALRARLIDGRLSPGTNVVERDLSTALGVSRTPLREALLGLEGEGLLRAAPQRGFFVLDLSLDVAREIYPLIGTLEALAIERGRPTNVGDLEGINEQFRAAADRAAAVRYDREWHEELLRLCRLPRTAAILRVLRADAARYEYRFFSGPKVIKASARQHDGIVRALRQKMYTQAAARLTRNWEQGLQWIEHSFNQ